ncbi:UNVERIFIED_CONTAM: hypothetical protein K2H54_062658 [Gekko kuhli]
MEGEKSMMEEPGFNSMGLSVCLSVMQTGRSEKRIFCVCIISFHPNKRLRKEPCWNKAKALPKIGKPDTSRKPTTDLFFSPASICYYSTGFCAWEIHSQLLR